LQAEILAGCALVSLVGGFVVTKLWVGRRQRGLLLSRLSRYMTEKRQPQVPPTLIKTAGDSGIASLERLFRAVPGSELLNNLIAQAGFPGKLGELFWLCLGLFGLPVLVAFSLGLDILPTLLLAVPLSFTPIFVLVTLSAQRRRKFSEQLPNAIDLITSTLRSGHSVPLAIRAVAEEIPSPCGSEFDQVMRRMNLGQPLAEALFYSSVRYSSYELDLIRRAVAIQAEVGGSLAELLDKTNSTLRQRLKLVRQVRVLTAQSRLTALIVGLMPFALALFLQYMSPGYLNPLVQSDLGRILLMVAVVLQVVGLIIMKKLSTIKV